MFEIIIDPNQVYHILGFYEGHRGLGYLPTFFKWMTCVIIILGTTKQRHVNAWIIVSIPIKITV